MIFYKYEIDITRTELFLTENRDAVETMKAKGEYIRDGFMVSEYSYQGLYAVNE